MSTPTSPTTRASSGPEWYITQQWGPLGILYCRHTCRYERGADRLYYNDEHTLGLLLSPSPFRFSHRQDSHTAAGFCLDDFILVVYSSNLLVYLRINIYFSNGWNGQRNYSNKLINRLVRSRLVVGLAATVT